MIAPSGKQRILNVLQDNADKNDRVPWVPFAGIHAGKLTGYTAEEVLKDSNKLFESLKHVFKLYEPDGMPIHFDLQIEAEILGCSLRWSDKSPPFVKSHPLENEMEIPNKIIQKSDGRLPIILEAMSLMKEQFGEQVALFGLITGPLTLASHLRGTKFFMDLIQNREFAQNLINYCTEIAITLSNYYIEAGMDIIAIVDPVISQISPRMFKSLLLSPIRQFFDHIREKERYSSFFVCGDATKNIEFMCQTHPDSMFVDENIDMKPTQEITKKYNIILGGNIPLTTTMLYGTQQDNMHYVLNLLDYLDKEKLVIAPGCDMPFDIPIDNVNGVLKTIKDPDKTREILESYETSNIYDEIKLPDYPNLKKPLIEVFTLDSEQCAACTYMKSMAFSALDEFKDKIEIIEYKWTVLENLPRFKQMKLKHLPCILINGEVKWESLIPNQQEYFDELRKFL